MEKGSEACDQEEEEQEINGIVILIYASLSLFACFFRLPTLIIPVFVFARLLISLTWRHMWLGVKGGENKQKHKTQTSHDLSSSMFLASQDFEVLIYNNFWFVSSSFYELTDTKTCLSKNSFDGIKGGERWLEINRELKWVKNKGRSVVHERCNWRWKGNEKKENVSHVVTLEQKTFSFCPSTTTTIKLLSHTHFLTSSSSSSFFSSQKYWWGEEMEENRKVELWKIRREKIQSQISSPLFLLPLSFLVCDLKGRMKKQRKWVRETREE